MIFFIFPSIVLTTSRFIYEKFLPLSFSLLSTSNVPLQNLLFETQHCVDILQVLVKQLKRDKENLEDSMLELQTDIRKLEGTIQDAKEREQLMVEYPDLNGPVNPDLQGNGIIIFFIGTFSVFFNTII